MCQQARGLHRFSAPLPLPNVAKVDVRMLAKQLSQGRSPCRWPSGIFGHPRVLTQEEATVRQVAPKCLETLQPEIGTSMDLLELAIG